MAYNEDKVLSMRGIAVLAGHKRLWTLLVVVLVLLIGWLAYTPALSGTFLLDDISNLADVQHVNDTRSALRFVSSGSAGPIGRPLSLASFLPQAGSWETGARPFLAVNIVIHLFNALLLGWFLYRLTLLRGVDRHDARFVAISAMALWLFMPLLASASLMVVQRMTTLSATFVLLGLNGYLAARNSAPKSANRALIGMTLVLCVAGTLSVLSKETGVLLPALVLVAELTILDRPTVIAREKWRRWIAVVLLLPTVAVIAYLVTWVPYSEEMILQRDFNAWERLLTQSRVLWEYLLNAFIPRPGHFGPYHDGYPVSRDLMSPTTLAAGVGWFLVVTMATIWRRRYRVLAFAVLWFLAGQLLESTTIPLEMYFEHRNYIPIIGPVFALCYFSTYVPRHLTFAVRSGLSLYIAVNALFLFSLASMWGNPQVASRFWHIQFPDSVRAATAKATAQLSLEGSAAAIRTLREFSEENPDYAYIRIPELSLACIQSPGDDHRIIVQTLKATLPSVAFSYTAGRMLSDLIRTVTGATCSDVDDAVVVDLAQELLSNPRYAQDPTYNQYHQQLMAQIARHRGDTTQTLEHLQRAIDLKPSSELNMMMVTTLVSDGRLGQARAYIKKAKQNLPVHVLKRYVWVSDLDELNAYVDAVDDNLKSEKGEKIDREAGGN